ncbi:MAG: hypothetical protein LBD38_02090, partial [Streptococcaceae bacterium]|nr:hypothetical protein [Streptococcaceae bacterium]
MLKKIGISILVLGLIGAGAYVAIEKNLFSRAGSKIQELTISKGKVGVLYDIQTVKTGYYDFDAAKYKGQKKYIYQLNGETIKETQKVDEQKRAYEARETTIWVVNKTAKYKTKDRTITMYYGHDRLDKSHVGWITASQFDKVDVQSAKSTKGADASSTKVFEPKETLNVQENDIANLVGDGVTDDSVGLKKLFDYTKDHPYTELYFPEGEYSISPLGDAVSEWDDRVMIELHSHTYVNMEKEARIVVKNKQTFCFFTRPTAKGMDGGVTDFHWKGGVLARTDDLDNGSKPMIYTLFSLVHVTNSSFEDTVFDGIQNVSGHNYDLCGNENITISGNSYIGYGNTLDVQPDI